MYVNVACTSTNCELRLVVSGTANLAHPDNLQACRSKVLAVTTTLTGLEAGSARLESNHGTALSQEGIVHTCMIAQIGLTVCLTLCVYINCTHAYSHMQTH